jgi:hypothetical protein
MIIYSEAPQIANESEIKPSAKVGYINQDGSISVWPLAHNKVMDRDDSLVTYSDEISFSDEYVDLDFYEG